LRDLAGAVDFGGLAADGFLVDGEGQEAPANFFLDEFGFCVGGYRAVGGVDLVEVVVAAVAGDDERRGAAGAMFCSMR
jgi:hypothetical protein